MISPFYYVSADQPLLDAAASEASFPARCEFLAPLDPLLWDRKLIQELFGFSYRWEIYTPAAQRAFGYYVLPVVYGEGFAGRIEPIVRKKEGVLEIKAIWLEPGVKSTQKLQSALDAAIRRFARFSECDTIILPEIN